jgi:hypothetical protein
MKFQTLEEVREYLSGDRIECLVCGKTYRRLQYKHLEMHGLDADGYRERFGIPWTFSLTSEASREATRNSIGEKQLAALATTKREGGKVGQRHRKPCPAVASKWADDAERGREASARRRVEVPCSGGCGAIMTTTALTAVQPIYCERCASPGALKQRRRYYRMKEAA